jgi:hypothetical protein
LKDRKLVYGNLKASTLAAVMLEMIKQVRKKPISESCSR